MSFDKKGLLAPGMSEEVTVTFTPHEWRYYHDTVKIFCGDLAENLVVPIHAYPSANDIALPRFIDFGKVAIGTSKSKTIPLSCKIPISFEYEVTLVEAHPDFEVTPLAGVIPADGATSLSITFSPTRHRTASAELKFHIAQFDWEPVTVSIVGCSIPDLHKEAILADNTLQNTLLETSQIQDDMLSRLGTLKTKKGRKPLENVLPTMIPDEGDRELEHASLGKIKVPPRTDQEATNFILSQTAGKRPLKEMNSFIAEQRQNLENRRMKAEAAKELAATGSVVDQEEEEDDDRQAIELRFEMQFREVDEYDKNKELKSMVAIGEDLLSEVDIEKAKQGRVRRYEASFAAKMMEERNRVETVRTQDPVAVPNSFRPALAPHWDENRNDMFSIRLQVIDRLVRAGSKQLMRVRARKKLEVLAEAMRAAGVTDRGSCKAWVDTESKAAAAGGKSGPEELVTEDDSDATVSAMDMVEFPDNFILSLQIPTAQSLMSKEDVQPVEVTPLDNFEEFKPAPIQPRLEYKVLHYEKFMPPPPAAYMRSCADRPRLCASLEELSVRGVRGDVFDGAEDTLDMPASCVLPPEHDRMSLLVPSTDCRTFVSFPDFTECDHEYRLSEEVPLIEPLKTEPLLPDNFKCLEYPWMATWRPQRRLPDPFEHFDPLPCSFPEAGGPLGPRLGGDPGGERLSFLPVGGHSRDLPSDTDSDEREDFQMPAPGDDMFEATMQRLKGPLPDSEQWHKERLAEERLQKQCDESGKVVRERMRELNKDLDYRNKVFLG
jgi:hypothetical protein